MPFEFMLKLRHCENASKFEKTSPKGFSASKCDVGNWMSQEFFEKLFGIFFDFFGKCLEFF